MNGIKTKLMTKPLIMSFVMGILSLGYADAQNIVQLYVLPAQPTSITPVKLVADVQFSSGDCSDKTLYINQTANVFNASAIHCLGVLTFICSDADTFDLGILPAANYSFIYRVDAGIGTSPCTPGIVPGPVDSIDFTVTMASLLPEADQQKLHICPNPSEGVFRIQFSTWNEKRSLFIRSVSGPASFLGEAAELDFHLDLRGYPAGLYLLEVFEDGVCVGTEKIIRN